MVPVKLTWCVRNELETDESHVCKNAYLTLLTHTCTHIHTLLHPAPKNIHPFPGDRVLSHMGWRICEASFLSQPTVHPLLFPSPFLLPFFLEGAHPFGTFKGWGETLQYHCTLHWKRLCVHMLHILPCLLERPKWELGWEVVDS
jgi:hypothetical protein